ncbi:hypothetical protein DERP_002772 [Dermatophagoides pteronyssinus]|uniref:Uncharacterized protein n=1 Tax=Dermatophagoides pteronyssinus TaxID=6956 RepID=A0ABQ8JVM8_DERPT|nr:hypothetical protein DERP_002772 [Dermatophagoides pteronyssinus]
MPNEKSIVGIKKWNIEIQLMKLYIPFPNDEFSWKFSGPLYSPLSVHTHCRLVKRKNPIHSTIN